MNIQEIQISHVLKVYAGRLGKCMCGCAGSYAYTPESRAEGSTDRGYHVTADEVSTREVTRVLRLVQAQHAAKPGSIEYGDLMEYAACDIGNRTYTIYLREGLQLVEAA